MKFTKFDIYFGLLLAAASIIVPLLNPGEATIQLLTLAAIWAIFAVGFDFVFGSLGMVSFGHATFLGVGGYAVALAAKRRGAKVTLVSGPTSLPTPRGVRFVAVSSAREMRDAVMSNLAEATVVVKSAAGYVVGNALEGAASGETFLAVINIRKEPA